MQLLTDHFSDFCRCFWPLMSSHSAGRFSQPLSPSPSRFTEVEYEPLQINEDAVVTIMGPQDVFKGPGSYDYRPDPGFYFKSKETWGLSPAERHKLIMEQTNIMFFMDRDENTQVLIDPGSSARMGVEAGSKTSCVALYLS